MNKEKLISICKEIGIDCVGVCGPGPYEELRKIIKDRIKNGYYTGMEEPILEKRIDPKLTLEDAESIIVCAFPYYTVDKLDSNISKYCYGTDYHIVAKEKLELIASNISNEVDGFRYKAFVDTGPLVDRYLAYISGIGYYGINNNIITDKYGSYIFIGYIISNLKLEYDKPSNKTCVKCNKCVKACPGKAILGEFEFNPKKCISYLTQKKEELDENEKDIMRNNNKVFGCDICQDVCPHNKNIKKTDIKEFSENLLFNIDYEEINNISNKEFKRRYNTKAFSWRGKQIIKRNLEILDEEL